MLSRTTVFPFVQRLPRFLFSSCTFVFFIPAHNVLPRKRVDLCLPRLPVCANLVTVQVWHDLVSSITAMSTPPNNERSPKKWFKQKFSSVFSSSRSPSRSLEGQSTGTNVPQIKSPSDGPRIIADRPGSGKKIGLIHKCKGFNTLCSKNYLTWSPFW